MQYAVFTVPIMGNDDVTEQLNKFLRGHKVVQVDRQFVLLGDCACWSFCVNYLETPGTASTYGEKREKVDYRSILGEEHFKVFSQLRACRKQIAEQDVIPAYAVFTDAELAQMAQAENLNGQTLLQMEGIGKKRLEKYGTLIIEMCQKEEQDKMCQKEEQDKVGQKEEQDKKTESAADETGGVPY